MCRTVLAQSSFAKCSKLIDFIVAGVISESPRNPQNMSCKVIGGTVCGVGLDLADFEPDFGLRACCQIDFKLAGIAWA